MFRQLDPAEERQFRDWAEKNVPPSLTKWDLYHPVCRQVWEARGIKPHDAKQLYLNTEGEN
jgi:hypothetical protein